MGQKVHPGGLRVGVIHDWKSNWWNGKKEVADYIAEDIRIRDHINGKLSHAGLSDILVDLRVDDHEQPIQELRRIYALHRRLFEVSPREDWLPLDGELRSEVDERLARLGYDSLDGWAGVENLEERVDGDDEIDPVVLEALREADG